MSKISGSFLLITPPLGVAAVLSGDDIEKFILSDLDTTEKSKKGQLDTLTKFSTFSNVGDFLEVTDNGETAIVVRLGRRFTVVEENKIVLANEQSEETRL